MSSLSHCPHCQQQVAIPDGTDPSALVRCPHCQAEFSLSDTSADRADAPPDVIVVTPPPAETPLAVSSPAEAAPAALPSSEVSPETARLDEEALELAEEASGLQSRAEGLQVTAHTSDLEPEAAATRAEALENEAQALAAQVEAIANPMEPVDQPTARPAMVVGAYRAMGGALVAAADALDALADVIQHKAIASQPDQSQQTPLDELGSDLAAAVGIGEHHDQDDDQEIRLDLPESILGDEAPLPMSDAELFLADAEPAAVEPAATEAVPAQPAAAETATAEPAATEPVVTEPAATEPVVTEPVVTEPAAAEPATAEPVPTEPVPAEPTPAEPAAAQQTAAAESPGVDGGAGLLKAVNLRSKAEGLRARGEGLLAKADAVAAVFGVTAEEYEAGEDGGGGEYALHGDWAAGQSAGVATAAGGAALPFPVVARKQREPKNPVRQFIAIFLGMITAAVLTYIVLNLVSDQFEFGICPKWFPHLMKSETTAQPAANPSPKASKPGKQAGAAHGDKSPASGASGQGAPVAKTGSAKQPSEKAVDPLANLPEAKPTPLDSSSGDTVPTTLPSGDMLPGPAAAASRPAETESPPAPADTKFGIVADMAKPPAYSSADLGWALKSAQDAFQGDLKATNYASLCRLGEVLTFIDPQKGVTDLPGQKIAVEKLLRDVGDRDKHKNVKIIAQLADKWLENTGRENPGVLLAGRVQKIGRNSQGKTIAVIALAKPNPKAPAERTIKMVSQERLELQEKDAVIILGGLAVGGRDGQRELVVWHGMTVKFAVPAPKAK